MVWPRLCRVLAGSKAGGECTTRGGRHSGWYAVVQGSDVALPKARMDQWRFAVNWLAFGLRTRVVDCRMPSQAGLTTTMPRARDAVRVEISPGLLPASLISRMRGVRIGWSIWALI